MFLNLRYPETDEALAALSDWPPTLKSRPNFKSKTKFQQHLLEHRSNIDQNNNTIYNEIRFYTDIIEGMYAKKKQNILHNNYSNLNYYFQINF